MNTTMLTTSNNLYFGMGSSKNRKLRRKRQLTAAGQSHDVLGPYRTKELAANSNQGSSGTVVGDGINFYKVPTTRKTKGPDSEGKIRVGNRLFKPLMVIT